MATTSYRRSFTVLFLIVATELIGFGLIIPVLPQIGHRFETTPFYLGLLMAAYSAAQFISAPLLGSLSDKYGRKSLLMISKLGTVLAYLLMAYAQTYWLLLASRLLDGFTGGNISVARAYVSDITEEKDRPKGMAIIGIAFGTGFIFGPALGGFLYGGKTGHVVPALTAGALSLLAFILTAVLLKEPEKRVSSSSMIERLGGGLRHIKHKAVWIICLVQLLYMVVFSGFETTFSLFTHFNFGFSTQQNSWLFMYAGILALIVQGGITRRSSTRLKSVSSFGLSVAGIGFIGLAWIPHLIWLLVFLAVLSLGIGFVNSYLPALLSLQAEDEHRGAVMGIYEGIGSLSRIIGPLAAYFSVIHNMNLGYFVFGLILMGAAAFLFSTLSDAS